MTSQKESWAAGREALNEVTTHPERTDRQKNALNRYMAGTTNVELHRRADKTDAKSARHADTE